jgi:hypothetical protein
MIGRAGKTCRKRRVRGPKETNMLPEESAMRRWGTFTCDALIALVAFASFAFVHELGHLAGGRLAGLHASFLNLTAVHLSGQVPTDASRADFAFMTAAGPLVTLLLTVVSFALVVSIGRRRQSAVSRFFTWWAISGISYVGTHLILAGYPVRKPYGRGDDFAVLAGYWHIPGSTLAVVALAGVAMCWAGGFWLRVPIATTDGLQAFVRSFADLRRTPVAGWRRLATLEMLAAAAGFAVYGGVLVWSANANGVDVLLLAATVSWALVVTLIVPWRAPGAAAVARRWILPGVAAYLGALAVDRFARGDLATPLWFMLPTVLTVAWPLSALPARPQGQASEATAQPGAPSQ